MNQDEFDSFVVRNANSLLRTAYLIVGDLHEAEDLVQETLFKVASKWPRVSGMENPDGIRPADPRQPGASRALEAVTEPGRAERSSA